MRIVTLVENTAGSAGCGIEHGLSFYIETKNHKILMDTGASDLILANAEKLGVDLKAVDTVVLSHGHYDHSGGLTAFRSVNPDAVIYMQTAAGGEYYADEDERGPHYIGLSAEAAALPGIILVPPVGELRIDSELSVFGQIGHAHPAPEGNKLLKVKTAEGYAEDGFIHEQCLVVREGGLCVLFSGCAHHGILNIMDRFRELYGKDPSYVLGGFHMMRKDGYTKEDSKLIIDTALALKKCGTIKYYTGHCTGEIPYEAMKKILEDKLEYIHCGDEVVLMEPEAMAGRNGAAAAGGSAAKTFSGKDTKRRSYMKMHKFFVWATVASFVLTMVTGYKRK